MDVLARVLFDESHRQAWTTRSEVARRMRPENPADCGLVEAADALRGAGFSVAVHESGPLLADVLAAADVLVLPHCSTDDWEATTRTGSPEYAAAEIDAIADFVHGGGGLVILAETEQPKYGNSLARIAARFGVGIDNATVQDPEHRFHDVPTWVMLDAATPTAAGEEVASDLFAGVSGACFYRSGVLSVAGDDGTQTVFARSHDSAAPPRAPLLVGVRAGRGRVVVAADSDFAGDDSIGDLDHRPLWINLVTWAAVRPAQRAEAAGRGSGVVALPAWRELVRAVAAIRPLQDADGAIPAAHHAEATALVAEITAALERLAPALPHQTDHLAATVVDFGTWARGGFSRPDFLDSLTRFHPERQRRHGIEHVVVFPMTTQNGNPNRNVEAVAMRTVWPEWIDRLEADRFPNPAFVPVEFAGFTAGYDTHSAVLFPETVAARETVRFSWGAIFCDREAARWRRVTRAAAGILRLALPPDAERLLADQQLAQETFAFWDVVHDRTHSRGQIPFDPFMIRQRMPYWMYGLEELRCDLATFREMVDLEGCGVPVARHVRLAILFDRLFRFPVSGDRVRNYDGLAGQVLFAWLHRRRVVTWADNVLAIDWRAVDAAVVDLCGQVEELYREGIDRSRFGHWLATHQFVAGLVPPHPASVWARGGAALPADEKSAVAAALPDEFPLSMFYEALRRRVAPAVEATRGITGASA
ncbi:MAG: DUF6421 family protein [Planctomycetota bacterium]